MYQHEPEFLAHRVSRTITLSPIPAASFPEVITDVAINIILAVLGAAAVNFIRP